jgi:hypothetical protein
VLERSASFLWGKDSCCGSYSLVNEDQVLIRISGDEILGSTEDLEYYSLFFPNTITEEEFIDLSDLITKQHKLPFRVKGQTVEILLNDVDDYPFELLRDESSEIILRTNLVVRNIARHKKSRQLKRVIKIKGFIKTEKPDPELIFHRFEDTSYNTFMKHIGSEFIIYEAERVKKDAKYVIENSDILHVCGHSVIDNGSFSFQLNGKDGISIAERDIEQCETVPEFIWMNSCHSSRWARLFLKKGCHAFIGSSTIIKDDFAEMASEEFYKHFSSGEYVGYAYYRMVQKFKNSPEILKIRLFGDRFYKI